MNLQAELKKKIKDEFDIFFLDKMRTSKENIFACSQEIELKKMIRTSLTRISHTLSCEKMQVMMRKENLLESSYRFVADRSKAGTVWRVDETLGDWIDFVMKCK